MNGRLSTAITLSLVVLFVSDAIQSKAQNGSDVKTINGSSLTIDPVRNAIQAGPIEPSGTPSRFYELIDPAFSREQIIKYGEIHASDFNYEAKSTREFRDAKISEVTLPTLDGSKLEPSPSVSIASPDNPLGLPVIQAPSESTPVSRVSKVDSITWKLLPVKDEVGSFREPTKHPLRVDVPDPKPSSVHQEYENRATDVTKALGLNNTIPISIITKN